MLAVSFIFCSNSFSKDYENEIKNLQKQIDVLNKETKSKNNNDKLNNILNNININGRIHVDGSWYDESKE